MRVSIKLVRANCPLVHQFAHDSAEVLFVTLQPLNFMTSALRKSITLVRERVTIQLSPPLERKFNINFRRLCSTSSKLNYISLTILTIGGSLTQLNRLTSSKQFSRIATFLNRNFVLTNQGNSVELTSPLTKLLSNEFRPSRMLTSVSSRRVIRSLNHESDRFNIFHPFAKFNSERSISFILS
ncbi:MAG: hypothetical protein ACTS44_01185 [Candidatus Hodgkinia cicadicola]